MTSHLAQFDSAASGGDIECNLHALPIQRQNMHLVDTRGFDRYKARVHMLFGVTQSWTRPVRDALPYLQRAFDEAMQAGDLTFAAYCRRNLISPMLAYGAPLAETQRLAYESLAYARSTKFDLVIDAIRAQVTYIDTLRGAPQSDAWWTDDEARRNTNRPISVFSHWTHRMQAQLMFGNLIAAVDAEARASRLLWSSSGHYETAIFVLFLTGSKTRHLLYGRYIKIFANLYYVKLHTVARYLVMRSTCLL
jgi:hypothetical protein